MKEIACTPMAENWGNDEACLCIHGFSSAPGIYRTLTDIAREARCDLYAPLLSGHGGQPEDMRGVTGAQWLADGERALKDLLSRYRQVHLLGHSMGGAICTWLAGTCREKDKLGKVMLLAPAYRLTDKALYPLAETDPETVLPMHPTPPPADVADYVYLYDRMYVGSLRELIRLSRASFIQVSHVLSPVWLLYGDSDPVVDPGGCAAAVRRFRYLRELRVYPGAGHQLFLDREREDVYRRIRAFFAEKE